MYRKVEFPQHFFFVAVGVPLLLRQLDKRDCLHEPSSALSGKIDKYDYI